MTPDERDDPHVVILEVGRRKRIAKGSGVDPADVSKLLKVFFATSLVIRHMRGRGRGSV